MNKWCVYQNRSKFSARYFLMAQTYMMIITQSKMWPVMPAIFAYVISQNWRPAYCGTTDATTSAGACAAVAFVT